MHPFNKVALILFLHRLSTPQMSPPNVLMPSVCLRFMEERRYTTSTWFCSSSIIYSSSSGVSTSWQRWDRSHWQGPLPPITGHSKSLTTSQLTLSSTLWDGPSGVWQDESFPFVFHKFNKNPSCKTLNFCLLCIAHLFSRYHTGTLAFGSLILAIVQIIRVILEYLDQKLKGLTALVFSSLFYFRGCAFRNYYCFYHNDWAKPFFPSIQEIVQKQLRFGIIDVKPGITKLDATYLNIHEHKWDLRAMVEENISSKLRVFFSFLVLHNHWSMNGFVVWKRETWKINFCVLCEESQSYRFGYDSE